VLYKLLLVRLCIVVWAFFSVFSIFCITSFGDCNRPQHQGGGCGGCEPPPPEMTCGFLIQLVFCKKKTTRFIGVEVEQETSAPPPKKNPGSAPENIPFYDVYWCVRSNLHRQLSHLLSAHTQVKVDQFLLTYVVLNEDGVYNYLKHKLLLKIERKSLTFRLSLVINRCSWPVTYDLQLIKLIQLTNLLVRGRLFLIYSSTFLNRNARLYKSENVASQRCQK